MPIATKTKTTLLTDDFKNQIASNLSVMTSPPDQESLVKSENNIPAVGRTLKISFEKPKDIFSDTFLRNLHKWLPTWPRPR